MIAAREIPPVGAFVPSNCEMMPDYSIEITDQPSDFVVDHAQIDRVVRQVLQAEGIRAASISIALVKDARIHEVNRCFLGHDYPTDVISFPLNERQLSADTDTFPVERLEGELVVSVETAVRESVVHAWSPQAELLLYVVHGMLHLCGYDDLTDEARASMRARERELLGVWGLIPTGLEA